MNGMGSDVMNNEYDIRESETVVGKGDVSYGDRQQWREWVWMS